MTVLKRGLCVVTSLFIASPIPALAQIEMWGYDFVYLQLLKETNICDYLGINKDAAARGMNRIQDQFVKSTYTVDNFRDVTEFALDYLAGERSKGIPNLCRHIQKELRPRYPEVFRK